VPRLRLRVRDVGYLDALEEAWRAHRRRRKRDAPTVVSTFAGIGGSSLGYSMAGYRELLAVEWEEDPVRTFRLNFPGVHVHHGDIKALSGREALDLAGLEPGELDVLDGSPPCQGFSTTTRGRRDASDPRNDLFLEFVRLLDALRPRAFVMENVTGMVKGMMKPIFVEILRTLKAQGYRARSWMLNAAHYGVPQARRRVIFIGYREDLGVDPTSPPPAERPIPVREAILGAPDGPFFRPKSYAKWARQLRPGQCVGDIHPKGHGYNMVRLDASKPAPTLTKTHTTAIGHLHPTEERFLSVPEAARISSFPDQFAFAPLEPESKYIAAAVGGLGNCVPPIFMRAIASHVRAEALGGRDA